MNNLVIQVMLVSFPLYATYFVNNVHNTWWGRRIATRGEWVEGTSSDYAELRTVD